MQFLLLSLAMYLSGVVVGMGMGNLVDGNDIDDQFKREERGFSMTQEAIKGIMAWRKLLWDSKPASAYQFQSKNFKRYRKFGDFSHAMKDFMSVIPEADIKKSRDVLNGKVYEGIVGDRKVVLRENGGTNDIHPTIELFNLNNDNKDKILYMGTDWDKRP